MHFAKLVSRTVLAIGLIALSCAAKAADEPAPAPVKVKAPPVADAPFFIVNDNRLTYSYQFTATDPGAFSTRPDGTINGTTAKQVYSFTHFDIWAYGTNFFNVDMLKSGHNDPASPCSPAGVLPFGPQGTCAGQTEFYAIERSTLGWNELFNTTAFKAGPLRNISFEAGVDLGAGNSYYAPTTNNVVAGLQFAFDLPYKGYFNVAPLAVFGLASHKSFLQCGLFSPGTPGVTCIADGNRVFPATWRIETNYYMDLGFLPESVRYFAISGRVSLTGEKGDINTLPALSGVGRFSNASKMELNSEPIRLTFDAGKAFMGAKYSHFVDVWVAYRYWHNKYGLDSNATPGTCTVAATGVSTNSCTEKSASAGISVKF
ncbi:hypothetical protein [Bradyrhizobium sp. CCBAU 53421]|uniref:hypothetical protein n=1 Tax=Bradyrhizobium sp. CCBAU 53421 TaxID=1325120 RepID=UPI00188CA622|nr:hypothetical protein [Bradyrhizobium sp. CCBAU 53421]QOZ31675.1 hypothetical protein XH92_08085 [Bradyrhizobium sp. CCBAU 53421]